MIRTISVFMLVVASAFACDQASESDGDDNNKAQEAVDRAQRGAARFMEQAGETLREKTADGSLLVQGPAGGDGGD